MGRWGHTATLIPNGQLMIFGVQNAHGVLNDDNHVFLYDSINKTWTKHPIISPPPRRVGHSATLKGKRVFVFGGSSGKKTYGDMHVLDVETFICSRITILSKQVVRSYHTATLVGDKYVKSPILGFGAE